MAKPKLSKGNIFWILVCMFVLGKCSYDIYYGNKMREALDSKAVKTTSGIVTSEKYHWSVNSDSELNTYKYRFNVNNNEYWGVAGEDYTPGQNIEIDYVIEDPEYNRPHYQH